MKYISDMNYEYKIKLNNNYLTLDQSNLIGCFNQSNLNKTDSNELVKTVETLFHTDTVETLFLAHEHMNMSKRTTLPLEN